MNCRSWLFSRPDKIKDTWFKHIYWVYLTKFLAKILPFFSAMWEERWFKTFNSCRIGFYGPLGWRYSSYIINMFLPYHMEWESFEGKMVVNLRLFCKRKKLSTPSFNYQRFQFFSIFQLTIHYSAVLHWTILVFFLKYSFSGLSYIISSWSRLGLTKDFLINSF